MPRPSSPHSPGAAPAFGRHCALGREQALVTDRLQQRTAQRQLLARRLPDGAVTDLTDAQLDVLIDAGYIRDCFLDVLQREDLLNPPFKPAVTNLLLHNCGPVPSLLQTSSLCNLSGAVVGSR